MNRATGTGASHGSIWSIAHNRAFAGQSTREVWGSLPILGADQSNADQQQTLVAVLMHHSMALAQTLE
jgi:hypothetical protein